MAVELCVVFRVVWVFYSPFESGLGFSSLASDFLFSFVLVQAKVWTFLRTRLYLSDLVSFFLSNV